jgi:glycosyltransferase involved in cell wall biosynthesis
MPCFNAGRYLYEALESITRQTGDFNIREIIVVDDRSDDEKTLRTLSEVARIAHVVVTRNERRRGPAGARNHGAQMAKGEWISFLDADDVLVEKAHATFS